MHCRIVDLVNLDRDNLLQLLDFLLYLYGFRGLIAEALYKLAHLRHFLLLVLVGTQLLLSALFAQRDVFVVFHLVVDNPATGNLQRPIAYIIDKCTVVTDQHHSFGRL